MPAARVAACGRCDASNATAPADTVELPRQRTRGAALATLLLLGGLRGQVEPSDFVCLQAHSFVVDAGLEGAVIHDVAFEPDGQVWLASSVGVVLFDGIRWSRFGIESGLPAPAATAIERDRTGQLWVGTEHGLGLLNGGRFRPVAFAGRSIRRLIANGDDTPWLCAEGAAGEANLARLVDGTWREVPVAARITDIAVSGGRVFVFAEREMFELVAGSPATLTPLGTLDEANSPTVVATPSMIVVASGSRVSSRLGNGRWHPHALEHSPMAGPLLLTGAGRAYVLAADGTRVWLVGEAAGRPVSPPLPMQEGTLRGIAQAPDGALWGYGEGSLLRFPIVTSPYLDRVPPAQFSTKGAVWFGDGQYVMRYDASGVHAEPDLTQLLAQSDDGDVLAATAAPATLRVLPADGGAPRAVSVAFAGSAPARAVFDRQGRAWLLVANTGETRVGMIDRDDTVTTVDATALHELSLSDASLAAADDGAWLCARDAGGVVQVAKVDRGGGHRVATPEPLTQAVVAGLTGSRAAVIGRSAVWVGTADGTWLAIGEPATHHATWIAGLDDQLLIGCTASAQSRSCLVTFDGRATVCWLVASPRLLRRDNHRALIATGDEVLCVDHRNLPVAMPRLNPTGPQDMLIDAAGDLWINYGTRPRRIAGPAAPPLSRIRVQTQHPEEARPVGLVVEGNYPYMAWSGTNPRRFTYRWRISGGQWSNALRADQPLQLELDAGTHAIEAVVSDAFGRESPPSSATIEVAPLRLQSRRWFPWAVAVVTFALVAMTAYVFVAHRRMSAQAGRLRIEVDQRTQKIRSELVRRIRVERHLRHQQRVLALLATGKPIDHALEALVVGVEEQFAGWHGAALLPHGDCLRPVAAPNLGVEQRAFLLECKLSPADDACAQAFIERRPVVVVATADDPANGDDYVHAQIGAICAHPILSTQGDALGTLVMVHAEPNQPSRDQEEILAAAAHIAALAIESKRGETERQRLQQEMLDAQKLRSLGLLAGGIAHDFNNLLTGILGNAGLARMQTVIGSPVDDALAQVEVATARAAELCAQLLAYSGRGRFTVKPIDLSLVVREMTQMLRLSMSRRVSLELRLDPNLPAVEADATQVRQVLMNLISNAAEAIGERDGLVAITTGTSHLTPEHLRSCVTNQRSSPGRHVYVRVQDNGCGMSEAVRHSMFDPFFTTKATGRGLGLAAVLGIVHGHRGAIEIESESGRGTAITVFLPASDKPAEREPMASTAPPALRGSGLAVVVEDEVLVRDLAASLLTSVGFEVAAIADGERAVAFIQTRAADLRLVLLDIVLPRLDGQEVLHQLRALRPDLPVILSSGNDIVDSDVMRQNDARTLFLKKPYGPRALLDALRDALALAPNSDRA